MGYYITGLSDRVMRSSTTFEVEGDPDALRARAPPEGVELQLRARRRRRPHGRLRSVDLLSGTKSNEEDPVINQLLDVIDCENAALDAYLWHARGTIGRHGDGVI